MGEMTISEFVMLAIERGSERVYEESLEHMERRTLLLAVQHTNGNQLKAAKILGITRGTLRTKLRRYGIKLNMVASTT